MYSRMGQCIQEWVKIKNESKSRMSVFKNGSMYSRMGQCIQEWVNVFKNGSMYSRMGQCIQEWVNANVFKNESKYSRMGSIIGIYHYNQESKFTIVLMEWSHGIYKPEIGIMVKPEK